MKIGLIDVDSHNYPNLALMKISAYHKAQGDEVEWWWGWEQYDRVYMTKVFDDSYSPDHPEPINTKELIKGGTGYDRKKDLPPEIEHMYPDYSLYPDLTKDTAYGFLTRGCPNACGFCMVCEKEGRESRKVAEEVEAMVKEHGGLYARTKLMEAASKITGIEITPIHEEEMMKARIENEANGIYFPPDDPDKW